MNTTSLVSQISARLPDTDRAKITSGNVLRLLGRHAPAIA